MNANVAEAPGHTRATGIGLPRKALLLFGGPLAIQRPLQIMRADSMNLTEPAGANHVSRLAHEWITRVIVGYCKHDAAALDQFNKLLRLQLRYCHGLVAHDVEAGLDKCFGDRKMRVIRRGNRHEVDAFVWWELTLLRDHVVKRSVGAVRGDPKVFGEYLGSSGIGG